MSRFNMSRSFLVTLLVAIFIAIAGITFTFFNARFYASPIGKVTEITKHHVESSIDERHNKDKKYNDTLKVQLLNTKDAGRTITVHHSYNQSKSEEQAYHPGDQVLLHIGKSTNDHFIQEKKRDTLIATMLSLFFLSLLIIGHRVGIQSILSLILNTAAILTAIGIYNAHTQLNLFLVMSLAVCLATTITLWLVIGWTKRTVITILSTLIGTWLCVGISWGVIMLTHAQGIKYETMSFLTLPPHTVFLASVMVGTLGAVMDVAITISSGMHEIIQRSPHITRARWIKAGRNIGSDIMGTMTNILLFSYLAGGLPMLLLYLKNANTLTYSISMNWSLEIARAITGGIGIVLTIPITIALMQLWYQWEGGRQQ
ncbi:YibE/F family protein [Staphylococcus chromogenes]|uniref:YibE/F family protein n=1 Tax=Staphylococcus chromogenes TaxID=46126 RepID=UPI0028866128|nr:YibE/F family protein [Staphylococcus chromogenes]MDT0747854.1 YibE/F family protein [Staphylococcus chromogenes]